MLSLRKQEKNFDDRELFLLLRRLSFQLRKVPLQETSPAFISPNFTPNSSRDGVMPVDVRQNSECAKQAE